MRSFVHLLSYFLIVKPYYSFLRSNIHLVLTSGVIISVSLFTVSFRHCFMTEYESVLLFNFHVIGIYKNGTFLNKKSKGYPKTCLNHNGEHKSSSSQLKVLHFWYQCNCLTRFCPVSHKFAHVRSKSFTIRAKLGERPLYIRFHLR